MKAEMTLNIKVRAMTKMTFYGKGQRYFIKVSKMPKRDSAT
jgi:hypothetical protein